MDLDENGRPIFTDADRTRIADEQDSIAADLNAQADQAERNGLHDAARRLRSRANEAADLADAARTSHSALARLY